MSLLTQVVSQSATGPRRLGPLVLYPIADLQTLVRTYLVLFMCAVWKHFSNDPAERDGNTMEKMRSWQETANLFRFAETDSLLIHLCHIEPYILFF
jgi:hypothetical protein